MIKWLRYCFDFDNYKLYIINKQNKQNDKANTEAKMINDLYNELKSFKEQNEKDLRNSQYQIKTFLENSVNSTKNEINHLKEIQKQELVNFKNSQNKELQTLKEAQDKEFENLKYTQNKEFKNLGETQKSKLDNLAEINKQAFANLNENTSNIKEIVSEEMKRQKDVIDKSNDKINNIELIFSNNKNRGSVGEELLEQIFIDAFGQETSDNSLWKSQFSLGKGHIVDFVVKHQSMNCYIPVDAKFPLSNDIKKALDPKEQNNLTTEEKTNIKKSIDNMVKSIKSKYVDKVDNTVDFALMFIPSEAVYNLLQTDFKNAISNANKARIYICSPTNILSLIAMLFAAGKHFVLNKNLEKITKIIEKIEKEYSLLKNRWDKHTRALEATVKSIKDLDITFNKIHNDSQKVMDLNKINETSNSNNISFEKFDVDKNKKQLIN